ncbi:hypothetical protein ACNOYE_03835 [Nannocystaceae bacterium ST9]
MVEHLEQTSDFLQRNLLVHALLGALGLDAAIRKALQTERLDTPIASEFDFAILGLLGAATHVRERLVRALLELPSVTPGPPRVETHQESLLR